MFRRINAVLEGQGMIWRGGSVIDVEHSFHMVKNIFGYRKTRYRGLKKNGARLHMLFALANVLRWSWRENSLGALAAAA